MVVVRSSLKRRRQSLPLAGSPSSSLTRSMWPMCEHLHDQAGAALGPRLEALGRPNAPVPFMIPAALPRQRPALAHFRGHWLRSSGVPSDLFRSGRSGRRRPGAIIAQVLVPGWIFRGGRGRPGEGRSGRLRCPTRPPAASVLQELSAEIDYTRNMSVRLATSSREKTRLHDRAGSAHDLPHTA